MTQYRWPVVTGDRVALAPHLDLWMQGVRFGTVIEVMADEENTRRYCVEYGPEQSVWLLAVDLLGATSSTPTEEG